MMTPKNYKAFISYSHKDEAWANWLHKALESYTVPKRLQGDSVPKKLFPIFRDRDELSSGADLSEQVQAALKNSESLIVICSPAAANSRWVNEEIRLFRSLGLADRIFCVIVDGDPQATKIEDSCFPPALLESGVGEAVEPLAADARQWADGKQLAKLKLIAGMLCIPLDRLRQRELQKRRKLNALAGVAASALMVIFYFAITARMSAEQRRDSGETLVALKLNELRTMLSEAGEPEDLQRLSTRDKTYLSELAISAGSTKTNLMNTALDLREEAIPIWDDGDLPRALDKFNDSWALIALSYEMDRSDQQIFFELGQANYWIGQIYLDNGELDLAEIEFLLYAEITQRLIQLQPQNANGALEMGYALTNLGNVQQVRERTNPDRTLQYMQSALEYNQIALVIDPENNDFRSEIGQSLGFLADAQHDVCDIAGAINSRTEQVDIESNLLESAVTQVERQEDLAFALTGLARLQAISGVNDIAIENYSKAVELIDASSKLNRSAREIRMMAMRNNLILWLKAMNGQQDEAWERSNELWEHWKFLSTEAGLANLTTLVDYATYLLDRAWLLSARGDKELATVLLLKGLSLLTVEAKKFPHNRDIGNALTYGAYRFWEVRGELPSEEVLSQLPDYRAYNDRTRACMDASRAVSKAVMLGEQQEAKDLVQYLLNQGYRETGFIKICRKYYSCTVRK